MNTPVISIIIPVYNAENFLRQCLDSIIVQTYQKWECILVDDGSTDNSGKICDEYTIKDTRFTVFHKENGGVSSARNKGLEEIKGEWVYFSDADDTLDVNGLKILVDETQKGCQFVMAGFRRYHEDGRLIGDYDCKRQKIISKEEAITELYNASDLPYQGYLVCKLFSSSVIKKHGLRFAENIYFNEDRLFIMQYVCRIEGDIAYSTASVYNVFVRKNSAMGSLSLFYNRKFATDFDAYALMKKEVFRYSKNKKLRRMAMHGIISSYMRNHSMMYAHKDYDAHIHWKMIKRLFSTGAIIYYFNDSLRSLIYSIVFLLFPQIIKFRK